MGELVPEPDGTSMYDLDFSDLAALIICSKSCPATKGDNEYGTAAAVPDVNTLLIANLVTQGSPDKITSAIYGVCSK